jgi:hypothetical protein
MRRKNRQWLDGWCRCGRLIYCIHISRFGSLIPKSENFYHNPKHNNGYQHDYDHDFQTYSRYGEEYKSHEENKHANNNKCFYHSGFVSHFADPGLTAPIISDKNKGVLCF